MSTHDVFSWKVIKPFTKTQIISLTNSLMFSAIFLPVTCKKKWSQPIRNILPVETALVEEDGVKVLVLLQVAVGGRETARLRTSSCVERLPTKTQVVLLAAVCLVPKQDVSEMQRIILCRDIVNNSLKLVLRGIALAILDDLQTHVWPKVVFFSSFRDDAL